MNEFEEVGFPTHSGTTVTAFFNSKFSKHVLPGASNYDMNYAHEQMAKHHVDEARGLHMQYMGAGSRKDRGALKKQMKFHNKQAIKHSKMADFFKNKDNQQTQIANKPNYKNASVNIPPNPNPAPQRPAPVAPPQRTQPTFNRHANVHIPPPPAPAAAPAPQSNNQRVPAAAPQMHHAHNANVHQPMYNPSQPQPGGNSNGPKHSVMQHITDHAAKIWHSFAPHVKHWFANKHPNSPISQSHLTGNPPMPISPVAQAQAHAQQANFHTNQASTNKKIAVNTKNPTQRAQAMQAANAHSNLASKQANLAKQARAKAKPAAIAPSAPTAPIAPNANTPLNNPPATPINRPARAMPVVPLAKTTRTAKVTPPTTTPKQPSTPSAKKSNVTKIGVQKATKIATKKSNKSGQKMINPALAV